MRKYRPCPGNKQEPTAVKGGGCTQKQGETGGYKVWGQAVRLASQAVAFGLQESRGLMALFYMVTLEVEWQRLEGKGGGWAETT